MTKVPVDLEFSKKYDGADSEFYFGKQRSSLAHKLSTWREVQVARKALRHAGEPGLVLDFPCGNGRFWPMLGEKTNRQIIAADHSADKIALASQNQPAAVVRRVKPLTTSAFAIELPDGSVDSIFSMGMLHHIGDAADRARMLKEFHRVTRDTLVVSLWVDGNYKAWKKSRRSEPLDAADAESHSQSGYVIPAKRIEAEFKSVGFSIQEHLDLLPLYAMWRIYILRKG